MPAKKGARDGGESWTDVTPRGLPTEIQINSIEPHPTEAGGLYLAATAYKSGDFRPWLYRTENFGRSWERIDDGIPRDHFTRVVRADPDTAGLLYAGTERGVYVSWNDGDDWAPLQLDLPVVPITDLAVKDGALVAATQGRGYWILDPLNVVRQRDRFDADGTAHLFEPTPAWRVHNDAAEEPGHAGTHAPTGVTFHYFLGEDLPADAALTLQIADAGGEPIRTFSRKPDDDGEKAPGFGDDDRRLTADAGLNRFVWDLRYPSVEKFDGLVLWNRNLDGPRALPGDYRATLTVGDRSFEVPVTVRADPRSAATAAELQSQFDFVWSTNRKLTEAHRAIRELRGVRDQVNEIGGRVGDDPRYAALVESGEALVERLTAIEETLYQTKLESPQDPLNFPIRLNDKLAGVMGVAAFGDHPPTASAVAVRDELVAAIDAALADLDDTLGEALARYNALADETALPAVVPEAPEG